MTRKKRHKAESKQSNDSQIALLSSPTDAKREACRTDFAVRYNGVLPKVTFLPANETFEFESGQLPYKSHGKPESLLDVAMNFGFHLEHACGGSCACTTCHVVVKQGVDNLSEMEDDEFDRVEQASDFQLNSRLGCQAIVKGDVTVNIPAWNRNYVSEGH